MADKGKRGRGDIPDEKKKRKKEPVAVAPARPTEAHASVKKGSTAPERRHRDSVYAGKVRGYFNSTYNLNMFALVQLPDGTYGKFSQLSYREPEKLGDKPALEVFIYRVAGEPEDKEAAVALPGSIEYGGKEISLEYRLR